MSQSPVILLQMNRLVAAISKIDGHAICRSLSRPAWLSKTLGIYGRETK
jgi:hypothetical protein